MPASSTTSTQPAGRPPRRLGEEPVKRPGRDCGLGCELVGGDAGGGGAEHKDALVSEGLGDRGERSRFARPGAADYADDPVVARGGAANHVDLFGAEGRGAGPDHVIDRLL
jgi:hypothetical protein